MSKWISASIVLLASTLSSATASAQGYVSGQVTIQERPGETTTDLANAVVYLVPTGTKTKPSEMHSQMAMQGRAFAPRVRVLTVGSKLDFPNQDPFSHNIFSSAPGAAFDLGIYGRGVAKQAQFKKAGVFPVYCNIHARMSGFVLVLDTPYWTQPGSDGRWSIAKVPAGKYTMHIWHERAPEQTRDIVIAATGLASQDVQLDARGYRFVPHKNKFGQEYTTTSGDRY